MRLQLKRFGWAMTLVAVVGAGVAACGDDGSASGLDGGGASLDGSSAPHGDGGDDAPPSSDGSALSDASDASTSFTVAAHRSFPPLVKNTGRVLSPLKLVTIVASNDALGSELFAFGDALVASAWWSTVTAPYGITGATSAHVTGPALTANQTPSDMTSYIQNLVDAGTAPAPNGETCYLLYLPDGVSITSGPGTFSAYHSPYPAEGQGLGDGWAVVSRAKPYGGGETQLGELTRVASHEVLEAATDPGWNSYQVAAPASPVWNGSVWSVFQVPGPVESGDLCEGTRLPASIDGGAEYQRIAAPVPPTNDDPCVPARAETYYDVSAPQDWYALSADGGTTSIPITGWSAAATSDWLVLATLAQASSGFAPLEGTVLDIVSPVPGTAQCTGVGMNNGVAASLDIAAPAGAASGDYAVVLVESYRVDPTTCWPQLDGDQFHMWLVGVYVP